MGTTNDWIMGREVFTTEEWNSFQTNPLSFKVKVESNEGIWVEQEKFLTMKNLNNITEWTNIRANITSIEFHKDGIAPANYVTSFDITDETSDPDKGNITLYTVDDGLGTNTYKAIVIANGTIYAPENCIFIFSSMTKLVTFNSENFKVDNVTIMSMMFYNCKNLIEISSLINWNTSNVTMISNMFYLCSNITNINALKKWNVSNVTNMVQSFRECNNLQDASGINNWDINANANFNSMFAGTPSHPEFTKFPNGTWSRDGTFSPNV